MRKYTILTIMAVVATATIFVGCNKKNIEGALLPTFEEYSFEQCDEGVANTVVLFQRIKNADRSEALAIIDTTNYRRTFAERAIEEPATFNLDSIAKVIHSELVVEGELSGMTCRISIEQLPTLVREGRVLCFETTYSIYLGGAHGYGTLNYDCYDIATGSLYDFNYLGEDVWGDAVRTLVYDRIVELWEDCVYDYISPDSLHIPESVRITEDGILLVYQADEIAPHVCGIISIGLSDDELAEMGVPLVWVKDFDVVECE